MTSATSRRDFLQRATAVVGAGSLAAAQGATAEAAAAEDLHVACNQYPWIVVARRAGKPFDVDEALANLVKCDIDGFESMVATPEAVDNLAPLLKKHDIQMRSFYSGATLHVPEKSQAEVDRVTATAQRANEVLGTQIAVVNPAPKHGKSDEEIIHQSERLDQLGANLRKRGVTLAVHNHEPELEFAAREFRHMMCGTDPENVSLCLDAHWMFRGSGNSTVALFDLVKLFGDRVAELHLRQSRDGVWTESLTDGDIDYPRLAQMLAEANVKPLMVVEQAWEQGTPSTMTAIEAFSKSADYTRRVFADFA